MVPHSNRDGENDSIRRYSRNTSELDAPLDRLHISPESVFDEKQSLFHVSHHPDLGLLAPNGVSSLSLFPTGTTQSSLDRYVKLHAHKTPGLRVLVIDTSRELFSLQLSRFLSTKGTKESQSGGGISHLCILAPSKNSLAEVERRVGKHSDVTYRIADIAQSLVGQGLFLDSYDVAIAPNALRYNKAALEHLKEVLKIEGRLILQEKVSGKSESLTSGTNFGRRDCLRETGFVYSGIDLQTENVTRQFGVVAHVHHLTLNSSSETIDHIVHIVIDPSSDTQRHTAAALTELLHSCGIMNTEAICPQDVPDVENDHSATFVVLLELDRPRLYSMDSEFYDALKQIVTSAQNIMWVNAAGGSRGGRPEYSLACGLARVMRSDRENLKFTFVSFEKTSKLSHGQLRSLVKVLERCHVKCGSEALDAEYMELDGYLTIPRILPATGLTDTLRKRNMQSGSNLQSNASYVVAGGLGYIGRITARYLVDRGARNLIILSRNGPSDVNAQDFIDELQAKGVTVATPKCDIVDVKKLKSTFVDLAKSMPPVRGCVQAAMRQYHLRFKDMTIEQWNDVLSCKVYGSWNLHEVLPKGLDFFIMLSSIADLLGCRFRPAYATSSTYEDALARYRVAKGEKATAIHLGPMVDDSALSADIDSVDEVLATGPLAPVTPKQFLCLLDYYCDPSRSVLSQTECQVALGLSTGGKLCTENYDFSRQLMLYPLEPRSCKPTVKTKIAGRRWQRNERALSVTPLGGLGPGEQLIQPRPDEIADNIVRDGRGNFQRQ